MPTIQTVLFDLDGTLIDSVRLILDSYRHTLAAHGRLPLDDEVWMRGIGTPLRVQLAPWAQSPEDLEVLVETYRSYNLAHHDRLVSVYDGVGEAVRALRRAGRRLGVVTSKNRDGTERGLRLAGLEDCIDVLVCADDVVNPKPHREPVDRAMALLGADPATTVYVGDSVHDMHCGRSAGVLTAAALWGPFGREVLESARPDFWLETPGELLELVRQG